MKYKVGDRVKIKSLDWYNENKDDNREIKFENGIFTTLKSTFLGQIMTIEEITLEKQYILMEDRYKTLWTDEMIEGLMEEETKPSTIEEAKTYWDSIKDAWICPEGYIFKDENGNEILANKIILEKKKKEYPKTYEECCEVLNIAVRDLDILDNMLDTSEIIYRKNLDRLLNSFRKLLVCRDAYWQIAGEEMGLGKPWEPDYDSGVDKFGIVYFDNTIMRTGALHRWERHLNKVLEFPTEEMRDAFYENFKELIEQCKELL